MLQASTALRNYMLATGSFAAALAGGFIKIYAGVPPATADSALSGNTLLTTITLNGDGVTGLTMATTAASGAISKPNAVWQGTNAATGTATFWRFVLTADTGAAITTEIRLQGNAATAGAELVMTNIALTSGATQNIDYFAVALPA